MLNIAVLVSGGGTNLKAIMDSIDSGFLKDVNIKVVVSSKKNAFALERAKEKKIPTEVISKKEYPRVKDYDIALINCLKNYKVDLVVMAGFLVILGEEFILEYKNKIINVHPSLIPSFCGEGFYGKIPHKKALEYGVKVTGATVHIVDLVADAGPIILQKAVEVFEEDTPETLQRRVMEDAEWGILPQAIKLFAEKRINVIDGKVKIRR